MNGCKRCAELSAQLQAARKARDWELAKQIGLEMSEHVQYVHSDLWAKSKPTHAQDYGRK